MHCRTVDSAEVRLPFNLPLPRSWSHVGMLPRCGAGSSDHAHHQRGCTWFFLAFPCVFTIPHHQRNEENITGKRNWPVNRNVIPEKKKKTTIPNPVNTCSPTQRTVPATLLHRPQQGPSCGNNFAKASASRCPSNLSGDRFKNTCRRPGTATRGDRCVFPTFPEVAGELGWVLPPALESPTLTAGERVWLEECGDPTCFHWNKGPPWLSGGGAQCQVPAPSLSQGSECTQTHSRE